MGAGSGRSQITPTTSSTEACDYCLGSLVYIHCYGREGANGCHESFGDIEAALRHQAKTGGCHFPGNPKLQMVFDGLCWRIKPERDR